MFPSVQPNIAKYLEQEGRGLALLCFDEAAATLTKDELFFMLYVPQRELRSELQQIAGATTPVLLVGEHGSGREAFARFMHDAGPRASLPFVTVVGSALRALGLGNQRLAINGVFHASVAEDFAREVDARGEGDAGAGEQVIEVGLDVLGALGQARQLVAPEVDARVQVFAKAPLGHFLPQAAVGRSHQTHVRPQRRGAADVRRGVVAELIHALADADLRRDHIQRHGFHAAHAEQVGRRIEDAQAGGRSRRHSGTLSTTW